MITKTIPISLRIVIMGIPFEFEGKSMETETATWPKFPSRWKPTVEEILGSEERN